MPSENSPINTLGSISQSTSPTTASLSDGDAAHRASMSITASDLDPRNASISIRDYIYFLPYPMPPGIPNPYTLGLPNNNPLNLPPHTFEPTHTLVLTSLKKTFVDIRIFRPFRPSDPELPNTGGPRERLDWAFSGTSSSHVIPTPSPTTTTEWTGPIKQTHWTHWLDSRHHANTPPHQIPSDSGIMYTINPTQTLEHGSARSIHTGDMQSYEEMWTDLEIEACWPKKSKVNIVLRVDVPEAGVKGVAVRLGKWCQAVMMVGSVVTIERWEFSIVTGESDEGGKAEKGEWKRIARIGDGFLPCALMCEREDELVLGGCVKFGDFEWRVEERDEWVD